MSEKQQLTATRRMIPDLTDVPSLRRYNNLAGRQFVLGVGAMKCGTSWLNRYLDSLTGVRTSPLKEVHYFDSLFADHAPHSAEEQVFRRLGIHIDRDPDFVHRLKTRPHFQGVIDRLQMVYDRDAYFAHFARLAVHDTHTLGEITPAYAVLPIDAFEFIREVFAHQQLKLKIVFLLRDPIDRLWSHLRFSMQRNSDFSIGESFHERIDHPKVLERCNYNHTLNALSMVFEPENLFFGFYEDLFTPDGAASLCSFLGLPVPKLDLSERTNETDVKIEMTNEHRDAMFERLVGVYDYCDRFFGGRLPAAWQQQAMAAAGS